MQEDFDLVRRQRLELENLRTRDEWRVDVEKWVVSRRADQTDGAVLDVRQQHILLRLVEAVNFVDEQDGFLAGIREAIRRGGNDAADVGNVGHDATEAFELAAGGVGDDLGERGFTRAGWAVEDD